MNYRENNRIYRRKTRTVVVFAASLLFLPFVGYASVHINNSVSVSASSGHNVVQSVSHSVSSHVTSKSEGTSTAHIFLKTIKNGEVVEFVDETIETSGEPIEYSYTSPKDEIQDTEFDVNVQNSAETKVILDKENSHINNEAVTFNGHQQVMRIINDIFAYVLSLLS